MTAEEKLARITALLHAQEPRASNPYPLYGIVRINYVKSAIVWLDGPFFTIESATEQLERTKQENDRFPKDAKVDFIYTDNASAFREVMDLTRPPIPPKPTKKKRAPKATPSVPEPAQEPASPQSTQEALAQALHGLIMFLKERDGEKTFHIAPIRACMAALARNANERQGPPR